MIIERAQLVAALPQYVVGEPLGRGAHGVVFHARHRRLGTLHAVKAVSIGANRESSASRRFLTEARVMTALDHPHIVRVNEYSEHGSTLLLVMEHLGGGTLERRTGRPVEPGVAAAWMLAVAEALAVAHRRGVVHRDIKPANLLFTHDGLLKVGDFGIAKLFAGSDGSASADLVGTPRYIAPEQISGGRIGPATDLYALGMTFYELLTGRLPFDDKLSLPGLLHHHLSVEPAPMQNVSPSLAALVQRLLRKDSAERPASARDFGVDLVAAADHDLGHDWIARSRVPLRIDGSLLHRTPVTPARPTGAGGGSSSRVTDERSFSAGPEPRSPVRDEVPRTATAHRHRAGERTTPGISDRLRRRLAVAVVGAVGAVGVAASAVLVVHNFGSDPPTSEVTGADAPLSGEAPREAGGAHKATALLTFTTGATADSIAVNTATTFVAYTDTSGKAYVRRAKAGSRPVGPLGGADTTLHGVAFPAGAGSDEVPDLVVTGGVLGDLRQWDPETGVADDVVGDATDSAVSAVAYSDNGSFMAGVGNDGVLTVYDAVKSNSRRSGGMWVGSQAPPASVALSPTGRLAAVAGDFGVDIWDHRSKTHVRSIRNWKAGAVISDVRFSPDGSRLIAGSTSAGVRIWNVVTGAQVGETIAPGSNGDALALCVGTSGTLMTYAANSVRWWGIDDGRELAAADLHTPSPVTRAAFNGNCTAVAVGLRNGEIRLWSVT